MAKVKYEYDENGIIKLYNTIKSQYKDVKADTLKQFINHCKKWNVKPTNIPRKCHEHFIKLGYEKTDEYKKLDEQYKQSRDKKQRLKKDKTLLEKVNFTVIDTEVTRIAGINLPKNKQGRITPDTINQFVRETGTRLNFVYSFQKVNPDGSYEVEFAEGKHDTSFLYRELNKLKGIVYAANSSGYENIFIKDCLFEHGFSLTASKKLKPKEFKVLPDRSNSILSLTYCKENGDIVEIRDILRLSSSNLDGTIKAFVEDASKYKVEVDKSWYRVQRFCEADCTDFDKQYMKSDVVGLFEAIKNFENITINEFGVNILNSLTVASYTKVIEQRWFETNMPNYETLFKTYPLSRSFFSGGYTAYHITNSYKVHKAVGSVDVKSMYPALMCKAYLPMGEGKQRTTTWGEFKTTKLPIKHKYYHVEQISEAYMYNNSMPTAQNKQKVYTSLHLATEDDPIYFQGLDVHEPNHIIPDNAIIILTEHISVRGVFKDIYTKLITAKEVFKKDDAGKSNACKIMANAGYGKIGENPIREGYHLVDEMIELGADPEEVKRWFHSVAIAGAITATGRYVIAKMNEALGIHFVIGDTDSVKFSLEKITIKEVFRIINETAKKYDLPIGYMNKKGLKSKLKGLTMEEAQPYVYEAMGGFDFEGVTYNFVAFQKKTYAYHKKPIKGNESKEDLKKTFAYTFAGVSKGDLQHNTSIELLNDMIRGATFIREKTCHVYRNGVYFYETFVRKGLKPFDPRYTKLSEDLTV